MIDWSKAPEDATHYCYAEGAPSEWLKFSGDEVYFWVGGIWLAYKISEVSTRHILESVARFSSASVDEPPSPYHVRNIWKNEDWIDFYRFYDMLKLGKPHQVGDSAIEHAMKKISNPGSRSGGKDRIKDIEEAIWSLQNAIADIKAQEGVE